MQTYLPSPPGTFTGSSLLQLQLSGMRSRFHHNLCVHGVSDVKPPQPEQQPARVVSSGLPKQSGSRQKPSSKQQQLSSKQQPAAAEAAVSDRPATYQPGTRDLRGCKHIFGWQGPIVKNAQTHHPLCAISACQPRPTKPATLPANPATAFLFLRYLSGSPSFLIPRDRKRSGNMVFLGGIFK